MALLLPAQVVGVFADDDVIPVPAPTVAVLIPLQPALSTIVML